MDRSTKDQANSEYRDLLDKRAEKVMQRDKELWEKGLPVGLDGANHYHYQDIDDWFNEKINDIKKKYGIA